MTKLTSKQLEQLKMGEYIMSLQENSHKSRKDAVLMSFMKGIAGGLGIVIGGSFVLGVLVWTLSLFNEIPIIEPVAQSKGNSAKTNR